MIFGGCAASRAMVDRKFMVFPAFNDNKEGRKGPMNGKTFSIKSRQWLCSGFSAAGRLRAAKEELFSRYFPHLLGRLKTHAKITTRGSRDAHQSISFSSSRSLTFAFAARLSFALAIAQRRLSFFTFFPSGFELRGDSRSASNL